MIQKTITPTKDNKICIELTLNTTEPNNIPTVKTTATVAYLTVSTTTLMKLLNCGKQTAIEIGNKANAKIIIGRRILWNTKLIQQYLDTIAV